MPTGVVLIGAASVYFLLLVIIILRMGRWESLVARWANDLGAHWGMRPGRALRALLLFMIDLTWTTSGIVVFSLALMWTDGTTGSRHDDIEARIWFSVGAWVSILVILVAITILATATGRPHSLVAKPIRGLSLDDADLWVTAHAKNPRTATTDDGFHVRDDTVTPETTMGSD